MCNPESSVSSRTENVLLRKFINEVERTFDDEPIDWYRAASLFLQIQALVTEISKDPDSIIVYSDYGLCLLYNGGDIIIGISDDEDGCHILTRDNPTHSEDVPVFSGFPQSVRNRIISYPGVSS